MAVGFGLGVASATVWQFLYGSAFLPALAADATGKIRLGFYVATAMAATLWLMRHLLSMLVLILPVFYCSQHRSTLEGAVGMYVAERATSFCSATQVCHQGAERPAHRQEALRRLCKEITGKPRVRDHEACPSPSSVHSSTWRKQLATRKGIPAPSPRGLWAEAEATESLTSAGEVKR